MTQLPKETQKNGDTNKSKRTNKHAKLLHWFNNQYVHQDNVGMPIPECQIVLGLAAARDYGRGTCANHLLLVPVGSSLPVK